MHITKWKTLMWKGHILYDSSYGTFWERHSYGGNKMVSGCRGLGREGEEKQSTEEFGDSENTAYIVVGAGHYRFVQTQGRMAMCTVDVGDGDVSTRVYRLQHCTTQGKKVANEGGCACAGTGARGKISVPASSLCHEPKTV